MIKHQENPPRKTLATWYNIEKHLPAKDLLAWYNSEIARYRNFEWQISGYAGALLAALIYLLADEGKRDFFVAHCQLASVSLIFLSIFSAGLSLSELHVHLRLNEFRLYRDSLFRTVQESGTYDLPGKKPGVKLIWRDWIDFGYFCGFEAVILLNFFAAGILLLRLWRWI